MAARGHVFIAVSLDGFIARPDGSIDWLVAHSAPDEDHGYNRLISGIDAIVMGRGTFETVRAFDPWPYDRPVTVLSRSLDEADLPQALTGRVTVSGESPVHLMDRLGREGLSRVYVDGGQVVQAFLRAGLIDTLVISTIPVLIGQGRRLFGGLDADLRLSLVDSRNFPSGLVQSSYRVLAPATEPEGAGA